MKKKNKKVFDVTVAALLHDIGKPFQRADFKLHAESLKKEQAKYAHSCWTSSFIKNNLEFLNKNCVNSDTLDRLASYHHNPSDVLQHIIAEADRASAGMDRKGWNEKKDDSELESTGSGYKYFERPMDSLFSRINIRDKTNDNKKTAIHRIGDLNEEKALFPKKEKQPLTSDKYKELCENFKEDFNKLDSKTENRFLESLTSLINRYLWCVPSTTREDFADIPLSDHLITSAAVAGAMAKAFEEDRENFTPKNCRFLWVTGDFAGIQNFIFSLSGESNRNLAKLLRGRSFTVSMLTVCAAKKIAADCGVTPVNIIYSSGGKFSILLPDTEQTKKRLEQSKTEMEKWVYEEYFGELKLVIDSGVSFPLEDFKKDRFNEVMKQSNASLNREKRKIFSSVIENKNSWVNNEQYKEMYKGSCEICAHEPVSKDNKGKHCNRFIEFGKNLINARYVNVIKGNESNDFLNSYSIEICNTPSEIAESVYEINLYNTSEAEKNIKYAEMHYSGYTPKVETTEEDANDDKTRNKTFEDISKKAKGLEALAVLKADVDDLGFIFTKGLGNNNTLSRRIAMSRMFNWFFTDYLPDLIKEKYENIYTLFAGGDDLCLIGPWDVIIDFSREMQKKFTEYTANNTDITISAGIQLFHNRFPVTRAVNQAETLLEEKSKNNETEHGEKNSVTVFGQTMHWGGQFNSQTAFAEHWENFVEKYKKDEKTDTKLNNMLYRFLNYWQNWNTCDYNDISKLKHRFKFIYDINRNIKKKELHMEEPLKSLQCTKVDNMENNNLFRFLPVGISIAMYKTRNKESKEVNNG